MKILFLDHGTTLGGGQVMATRLLPLLRERLAPVGIDALVGCRQLDGDPIPATMHGLRRVVRGYDLVYANTPRTAIAVATTRVPFVWHKHHPGSTWAQRIAARRARRVISVSRFGAPRGDNVVVIPNGVPPMRAAPASDLPIGRKILMLGRLHPEKGHDLALAALQRMRNRATLIVAGPGEWPGGVPAGASGVRLLGLRDDVDALLAACDVLVFPSRCDEGAPLAVLEAQAAGVPVVATRSGGVPEIVVENRTAFLVPKEDPHALAIALDRALTAKDGDWGDPEHTARFTLERCAASIADELAACLHEAAGVSA